MNNAVLGPPKLVRVPYEVVVPYSNQAAMPAAAPALVTFPLIVAPVALTDVAGIVTTVGGNATVEKVMSLPFTVVDPATAFAR